MSEPLYLAAADGGFALWTGDPARPVVVGWWPDADRLRAWIARRRWTVARRVPPAPLAARRAAAVVVSQLDGGRACAWRGSPDVPQWVTGSDGRPRLFARVADAAAQCAAAGAPPALLAPRSVATAPAAALDPGTLWHPFRAADGWGAWRPGPTGPLRAADATGPLAAPTLGALAARVAGGGGRLRAYAPPGLRLAAARALQTAPAARAPAVR